MMVVIVFPRRDVREIAKGMAPPSAQGERLRGPGPNGLVNLGPGRCP